MKSISILFVLVALGLQSFAQSEPRDGAAVYSATCLMCHGEDGDKGMAGAKHLSVSVLTDEEATTIVHDGKGAMMAYGTILSEAEIKNVVDYIKTLRATKED